MPYKVKNITKDPRRFREHKNATHHFLRPGEEIIIGNPPFTNRTDVFEITDLNELNNEEEPEKKQKRNKVQRRNKE